MHRVETPYMYEGVEVMPPSGHLDSFRWADIVCTHLDFTQHTMIMASAVRKPVIHFIHNDIEYSSISNGFLGNHIVYNSKWIADKLAYKWPSIILHPPCDVNYYNVCEDPIENEYITLISLNENKGGKLFYRLAEAMPHKKFLGVVGSYDHQIVRHDLPNVTIVPNTPNILEVYKKTRILLMPSAYESWGRTATEAMCSGIPVICTPTPGLKENCGDAAIYVPRRMRHDLDTGGTVTREKHYDIKPMVEAINKLDNEKYYREMSAKARARALELDPAKEMEEAERFICNARFDQEQI